MTRGELHLLGCYLYGSRWQTALARELAVAPRTVRYWSAGRKPISARRAEMIGGLARIRHLRRAAAERARYLDMVETIVTPSLRAALLAA